jgi:hypothetical protein
MSQIFHSVIERKAFGTPILSVHSFEHVNNQKQDLHNIEITQTGNKIHLAPVWNADLLHGSSTIKYTIYKPYKNLS